VVFLITLFYPCTSETLRGIVFLTGQVIFFPEWPKGEFVSFCVGCILLDKITSM
jgi:hypothetical protein